MSLIDSLKVSVFPAHQHFTVITMYTYIIDHYSNYDLWSKILYIWIRSFA